ncbi:unnamed protein product [Thlaspi arvense]|uniref:Uncharacterized protein n=1 Tax=Thlaspi arvense TaxID=13288 RepID=A0AAU9RT04_THLAR|nr:unnamed protein product [Thlaspi arvense]
MSLVLRPSLYLLAQSLTRCFLRLPRGLDDFYVRYILTLKPSLYLLALSLVASHKKSPCLQGLDDFYVRYISPEATVFKSEVIFNQTAPKVLSFSSGGPNIVVADILKSRFISLPHNGVYGFIVFSSLMTFSDDLPSYWCLLVLSSRRGQNLTQRLEKDEKKKKEKKKKEKKEKEKEKEKEEKKNMIVMKIMVDILHMNRLSLQNEQHLCILRLCPAAAAAAATSKRTKINLLRLRLRLRLRLPNEHQAAQGHFPPEREDTEVVALPKVFKGVRRQKNLASADTKEGTSETNPMSPIKQSAKRVRKGLDFETVVPELDDLGNIVNRVAMVDSAEINLDDSEAHEYQGLEELDCVLEFMEAEQDNGEKERGVLVQKDTEMEMQDTMVGLGDLKPYALTVDAEEEVGDQGISIEVLTGSGEYNGILKLSFKVGATKKLFKGYLTVRGGSKKLLKITTPRKKGITRESKRRLREV